MEMGRAILVRGCSFIVVSLHARPFISTFLLSLHPNPEPGGLASRYHPSSLGIRWNDDVISAVPKCTKAVSRCVHVYHSMNLMLPPEKEPLSTEHVKDNYRAQTVVTGPCQRALSTRKQRHGATVGLLFIENHFK